MALDPIAPISISGDDCRTDQEAEFRLWGGDPWGGGCHGHGPAGCTCADPNGGQHKLHPDIDLAAEWQRLITGGEEVHILMLFNAMVFVPFGMALAESFAAASSAKHQRSIAHNPTDSGRPAKPTRTVRWQHIGYIAIIALLLSLTIETLQLKLHVGMFEVTDLVLNTAGAVLGGAIVMLLRIK